jgi:hypothetical protein
VTPQQHKQHLLALADALKYQLQIDANGELIGVSRKAVDEAVVELRNIAARLTPGVSDAMCESVRKTLIAECGTEYASDGSVLMPIPDEHDIRKALEAVFPLVDDGQAKDEVMVTTGRTYQNCARNSATSDSRRDCTQSTEPYSNRCGRLMVGCGSDFADPICTLAKGHFGVCLSTSAEANCHTDFDADAAMAAPPKDTTP